MLDHVRLSALVLGDLSSKAMVLVSFAYLARVLGGEGFGKLAWAQAVVGYLSIPADFGLASYGAREIAKRPATIDWYLRRIVSLRLILAVAIAAAALAMIRYGNTDPVMWGVLAASTVWLLPNMASLEWIAQGTHRVDYLGVARFLNGAVLLLLVLVWARLSGSVVSAAWLRVGAECAASATLAFLAFRAIRNRPSPVPGASVPTIFRESVPLLGATVLTSLYAANFDVILLGLVAPPKQVGVYAASFRLYLMIALVPKLVLIQYFPRFAEAFQTGAAAWSDRLLEYQSLCLRLALPPIILLFLLAPEVIALVFGHEYLQGSDLIRILCPAAVAVALGAGFPVAMMAAGHSSKALLCYGAAMIVNMVLNLSLVPLWGTYGAAASVVAAEIAVLLVGYWMIRRLPGATSQVSVFPVEDWNVLWVAGVAVSARVALHGAGVVDPKLTVVLTGAATFTVWLWCFWRTGRVAHDSSI